MNDNDGDLESLISLSSSSISSANQYPRWWWCCWDGRKTKKKKRALNALADDDKNRPYELITRLRHWFLLDIIAKYILIDWSLLNLTDRTPICRWSTSFWILEIGFRFGLIEPDKTATSWYVFKHCGFLWFQHARDQLTPCHTEDQWAAQQMQAWYAVKLIAVPTLETLSRNSLVCKWEAALLPRFNCHKNPPVPGGSPTRFRPRSDRDSRHIFFSLLSLSRFIHDWLNFSYMDRSLSTISELYSAAVCRVYARRRRA